MKGFCFSNISPVLLPQLRIIMSVNFLQLVRSLWHLEQGIKSGTGRSMETMALLVPATPRMLLPSLSCLTTTAIIHIAYMGDNGASRKLGAMTQKTIPRYLDADVSLFGTNSGPLRLVYHVSERSRLLLFGRVANEKGPINPTMWAQGDDMFFINCARRRMKRDGYIGMRQRRRDQWVSACFPRRGAHNEQNKFMLFRLLPVSSKSNSGPRTAILNPFKGFDIPRTLDDQLEKYGVSTK